MNKKKLDQRNGNLTSEDGVNINRLRNENISYKKNMRNGRIALIVLMLSIIGMAYRKINKVNVENKDLIKKGLNELNFNVEVFILLKVLLVLGFLGCILYSLKTPIEGFIFALLLFVMNQIYAVVVSGGISFSIFGVLLGLTVIIFLIIAIKSSFDFEKNNRIRASI